MYSQSTILNTVLTQETILQVRQIRWISTCLEEEKRICYHNCACFYVSVAQGTEHRSPKAGVGGSNPLRDTKKREVKPFFTSRFFICVRFGLPDFLEDLGRHPTFINSWPKAEASFIAAFSSPAFSP